MSKRKREKMAAKAKRHTKREATVAASELAPAQAAGAGSILPDEMLRQSPHLEKMTPSWQALYAAIRKAVID